MVSDQQFRLVVRRGPQPNQQYELNRDTITIGRDITNDIVINDPEVSRHHARLIRTANGYAIEDLRSTNGTFINRERITGTQQLHNGDLLSFGETVTLAYETVGGEDARGYEEPTVVGGTSRSEVARRAEQPSPAERRPKQQASIPQPEQPQPAYTEEEGLDRNRWLVIGCATLTLVFCCAIVGAGVLIDYYDLYCDVPVMQDIQLFCDMP